jgi:hypothetical protein
LLDYVGRAIPFSPAIDPLVCCYFYDTDSPFVIGPLGKEKTLFQWVGENVGFNFYNFQLLWFYVSIFYSINK